MRHSLAISTAVAIASLMLDASAQTLIQESTLSADAAQELATTALAYCRKEGHKVSITVLDQTGRTKVAIRDDGAAPHSFEHSLRKAYTALTYNMPSGEYGKRAAANSGAIGPQLLANITTGLSCRGRQGYIGPSLTCRINIKQQRYNRMGIGAHAHFDLPFVVKCFVARAD